MTGNVLAAPQVNLAFAWLWIFLGFVSGAALGMRFHQPNWMGGYSSFPRRLYRLGHISFFGLGLVNLLFFFTLRTLAADSALVSIAGWAFVAGGVLMPICCLRMAHFPQGNPTFVFAAPVASLLVGGLLTLILLLKP